MSRLAGKKILLGISGGIAAYKTPELIRVLQKAGAEARAVLTANAGKFVAPLTLATLTGKPIYSNLFALASAENDAKLIEHTEASTWADVMVLAPATANLIARAAGGMADDPVTTLLLAFEGPVLVCPSMNTRMLNHPATKMNLDTLEDLGYHILEPDEGDLACGETGAGRMPDLEIIAEAIEGLLAPDDLSGRKVLITAGPTREKIDEIRFLSNRSSGKTGIALAKEARRRGAEVALVLGPTSQPDPPLVRTVRVETALEMQKAVNELAPNADIIVKNAAVADFRPKKAASHKLKKAEMNREIALTANPDILAGLGKKKRRGQRLIGFAAESTMDEKEAARKLKTKNLDLIVLNAIDKSVGAETSKATLIDAGGGRLALESMDKSALAARIFDRIVETTQPKRSKSKR